MELFQLANFHKCGMDNCDNGAYHIEDANGELVDEDLVDPSYPKVNNPYIPHYVSDTDLDDAGGEEDDPVGELLTYYEICRDNRGPGGGARVAR